MKPYAINIKSMYYIIRTNLLKINNYYLLSDIVNLLYFLEMYKKAILINNLKKKIKMFQCKL